jgi:hypothetical protein
LFHGLISTPPAEKHQQKKQRTVPWLWLGKFPFLRSLARLARFGKAIPKIASFYNSGTCRFELYSINVVLPEQPNVYDRCRRF